MRGHDYRLPDHVYANVSWCMVQDFMLGATSKGWSQETHREVDEWFDDLCAMAAGRIPHDERARAYAKWTTLPALLDCAFSEHVVAEFTLEHFRLQWNGGARRNSREVFERLCAARRKQEDNELLPAFEAWRTAQLARECATGYERFGRSAHDYPHFRAIEMIARRRKYSLPIVPFSDGSCVEIRQRKETSPRATQQRQVVIPSSNMEG